MTEKFVPVSDEKLAPALISSARPFERTDPRQPERVFDRPAPVPYPKVVPASGFTAEQLAARQEAREREDTLRHIQEEQLQAFEVDPFAKSDAVADEPSDDQLQARLARLEQALLTGDLSVLEGTR